MDSAHEDAPQGHPSGSVTHWKASTVVEVPPEPEHLPDVFEAVEEFGERAGWPMAFGLSAQLVLEEMMLNVMNHSGATDPVSMRLMSGRDEAVFEIIDRGVPFDPTEAPAPPETDSSSLAEMAIGGLGIHLVRSMVKEMRYRRDGDVNRLTLVLELPTA